MRGENDPPMDFPNFSAGSSPHARGKLTVAMAEYTPQRLIPACAGKTGRCPQSRQSARAHPRMRGENTTAEVARTNREGSSPHARGKLELEEKQLRADRLIPACAGKTVDPAGKAHRA